MVRGLVSNQDRARVGLYVVRIRVRVRVRVRARV
jgi:hypothetical protein